MSAKALLKPYELDSQLRYPAGRSARLARRGLIPHVVLPDGEIRFDPELIEAWLRNRGATTYGEAVRDAT
jgi:hypothetical protein